MDYSLGPGLSRQGQNSYSKTNQKKPFSSPVGTACLSNLLPTECAFRHYVFAVVISSLTGLWEGFRLFPNAINILSLTGHFPCIIHKFAQNPLLLWCGEVFWISGFNTLFFKKNRKPGRIVQNL